MYQHERCSEKAKELVKQMTLAEKLSQLTCQSPSIERLGIPAYSWCYEVASSWTATSFPQAIGLAAIFDATFIRKIADVIATEGRAKYNERLRYGDRDSSKELTFCTSNINIFRDPRWSRGYETYGEDPYLSSRLGVAFIQGLQGDGSVMKAAACVKYYLAHSEAEVLRHEFNAVVNSKDLWETYLPTLEACVKEVGVVGVMEANSREKGEPCLRREAFFQGVLRERWGHKGYVASDYCVNEVFHLEHGVNENAEESVALALNTGCGLNCGNIYPYLQKAQSRGLVSEAITKAVERLMTIRYKLGLFEGCDYDNIPYEVIDCPMHRELAIEAARKSVVLLQNKNGILPLNREKIRVLGVIGPNANSRLVLKGNDDGRPSRYITVLEGIQDEVGEDIRVLYAKGCELNCDLTETLTKGKHHLIEAMTVAERSDVVILCLGLDETLEGERLDAKNGVSSRDKEDLELPEVQRQLLVNLVAVGKPIVLCLMAGSALNISYAVTHCEAIINAWYPGARGGKAIADILFGHTSPSGKLPITFYRSVDHLPKVTDYSMDKRTYRYLEEKPIFSFGFGLTYGDIVCTHAIITSEIMLGEPIEVMVKVVNQGKTYTEDVIQIYIKNECSPYGVKNFSFCGFKRVALKPKEEDILKMYVPWKALTIVDHTGVRRLDNLHFTLSIATFQPDERSIELMRKAPIFLDFSVK